MIYVVCRLQIGTRWQHMSLTVCALSVDGISAVVSR